MGIKSLTGFLRASVPSCLSAHERARDLPFRRIAVDVSIFMYKFAYRTGEDAQQSSHLCTVRFSDLHNSLETEGFHVIYVFDGKPCAAKQPTIEKRARRRERMDAVGEEKREERKRKAPPVRVTAQHYSALKRLFDAKGIPYLQGKGDAEKACAWLNKFGVVDAVASDDFDALAYGATHMVRNLVNREKIEVVDREAIKRELGLDEEGMTRFFVLSGCDFAPFRYGPRRAIGMLRGEEEKERGWRRGEAMSVAMGEFRNEECPFSKVKGKAAEVVGRVVVGNVLGKVLSERKEVG